MNAESVLREHDVALKIICVSQTLRPFHILQVFSHGLEDPKSETIQKEIGLSHPIEE
jgi:hypothetical protein